MAMLLGTPIMVLKLNTSILNKLWKTLENEVDVLDCESICDRRDNHQPTKNL